MRSKSDCQEPADLPNADAIDAGVGRRFRSPNTGTVFESDEVSAADDLDFFVTTA